MTSRATKKVVELATAKLAASANGIIAVATLEADTDLLALVDDAAMLSSLLADRIDKEWKLIGTDYVYVADSRFVGTAQYDLILASSAATNVAGTEVVVTWADAVSDATDITGFVVKVGGTPITVSANVTTGTTSTLTVSPAILNGDVVTVSYDSEGAITDASGRDVRAFTDLAVTNNVPV